MAIFAKTNILSYHRMMHLYPDCTCNGLLKMYPTMTKDELKKLNKLGEKFWENTPKPR
jgi:hypothetical protein